MEESGSPSVLASVAESSQLIPRLPGGKVKSHGGPSMLAAHSLGVDVAWVPTIDRLFGEEGRTSVSQLAASGLYPHSGALAV